MLRMKSITEFSKTMDNKIPECFDCGVKLEPSYARVDIETEHATYICRHCLRLYEVSMPVGEGPTYCEKL